MPGPVLSTGPPVKRYGGENKGGEGAASVKAVRRKLRVDRLSAAAIAEKIRGMSDDECRRELACLLGVAAAELPCVDLAPATVDVDLALLTDGELDRLAAGEPLAKVRPDWRTLVKQ